ncbi:hypothetical protein LCGC14_0226860 [marine sediment metagenome]|uniref:Integrase n=2 Tax=root TaxID=1 RepID=A0AA91Z4U9_9GAMM|nr:hypothetical protein CO192_16815 [Halopseudomonas pelagia]QFY57125.1 hypothetical protein EAO82_12580 [Halopseudomonas pelagia]
MNISLITQRLRFDPKSSQVTTKKVIGRLKTICRIISEKFPEIHRLDQIRLKHLQHVRNEGLAQYSPATVVDYERTLIILVEALGKTKDWLPPLKLKRDPSKGGRPSSTKVIRSRSRHRRGIL